MVNKRICFTGPSGSGKSTLARFVGEQSHLQYFEGSAGLTLSEYDANYLKAAFGYIPSGHANVIRLSNDIPAFGRAFQQKVLNARINKFLTITQEQGGFVTERSPLDNLAYYWTQCLHNSTDGEAKRFVEECVLGLRQTVSHLILVKTCNPEKEGIENNGSRIANLQYQKYISNVFSYLLEEYLIDAVGNDVKIMTIDYWDLDKRKQDVLNFIG